MSDIWKTAIEKIILSPLYETLAMKYYHQHFVTRIAVDKEMDSYTIQASLDILGMKETCHMQLDMDGNISLIHCTCENHDETTLCAHIAAVLITLQGLQPTEFPFSYVDAYMQTHVQKRENLNSYIHKQRIEKEVHLSRELIQKGKAQYQNLIESELQDETYELQATLELKNSMLYVTYRVGHEKFYIIRSIQEFMDRIDAHEVFSYGKNLQFLHQEEAFDEAGKRQIQFLRKAIGLHNAHKDDYFYKPMERYLVLNEDNIDAFFDTYLNEDTSNFQCIESETKLGITVEELEDIYVYSYQTDSTIDLYFGKCHIYNIDFTKPMTITRYTLDSHGTSKKLIEQLMKEPISVLKSEQKDFQKYVLSDTKDYLQIDIPAREDILEYESIRLYGDINDLDQVTIQLKYVKEHGQITFGLDEANTTDFTQDLVEGMVRKYAQVIDHDTHMAFIDASSEDAYNFVYTGLPKLSEYCEIYVSDALKKLSSTQKYNISVGVRLVNDLLEIDVNSTQIPKNELANVLKAYRRKRKFYRLKNGQLLSLNSDDLKELDQFVEDYHILPQDLEDSAQLPSYRMLTLDEDIKSEANLQFERDQNFKNIIEKWNHKTTVTPLPLHYQNILRAYQKEGYQWLMQLKEYGFHGILADDMGLGKTIQVIAMLDSLHEGTSLVVCPASLIYNWEDEVHKFSETLNVKCICGNAQQRKLIIQNAFDYDLVVTSYDYIRRDIDYYEDMKFQYVILDEAQNIKNQKTKNAITVKKLQANHRLALSGTPIENSLAELW